MHCCVVLNYNIALNDLEYLKMKICLQNCAVKPQYRTSSSVLNPP